MMSRQKVFSPISSGPGSAGGERSGILAAGNFIVDFVKVIDSWPEEEMLASILAETRSNGGGPYNVLKDLARMGAPFPLGAIGMIGDDELGEWIEADCAAEGIDTSRLRKTSRARTSYTDAMTVESTGRRTFFHHRGANALLSDGDISFHDSADAGYRIFHLGYLMLLDQLDAIGGDGTTGAARLLQKASAAGMLTTADMVSVPHEDLLRSAGLALPFVDVMFLNEVELGMLTKTKPRVDEKIELPAVEQAARTLLERGVRQTVVVHFPEGVMAVPAGGEVLYQDSLKLPEGYIKGATGAGDAFAAGVLWSLHEGDRMAEGLRLGVCAAAKCLGAPGPSEGLAAKAECLELAEKW